MLSSLSEHQLLLFWVQLAALVGLGRVLGLLLRRIGQPTVIGELGAGLLLGPSVFGKLSPQGFAWFLPDDAMSGAALVAVGWVGAALLLAVTGFETDLALIRRFGKAAASVTAGSLVLPFAGGLAVGFLLPARFAGTSHSRVVFALFIATALSISSLPVIAKILGELHLLRRNFGQINLAAGMANDTIGWILLGIISGLATSGSLSVGDVLVSVGGMVGFLVLAVVVGRPLIDLALRRTRTSEGGAAEGLTVAVLATLVFGVGAQALGLEAVLGAFVAGIMLGRSRFQHEGVLERMESLTMSLFAPLFFATAGLRVDLGLLGDPTVLAWSLVILAVASVAKFVGAFVGARFASLSTREGFALGAGLNARGAMEVVIATVGLGLGVLNDAAYTAIVLMAMATSIMAPPTLRLAVRNWRGSDEEQARLEREETMERNLVVKGRRMLLPSRGMPNSIVTAQVLHFAWPPETPVTVLSVAGEQGHPDVSVVRDVVAERDHEVKAASGSSAVEAILAEAKLGYGVIGLGVSDVPRPGAHLSAVADDLMRRSSLPLVLVRRARHLETTLPGPFARALVPVSGTAISRAALELATNLAQTLGTELLLAHVATRLDGIADAPAEQLVRQAATRLDGQGISARTVVPAGTDVADALVGVVGAEEVDLVVIGATARQLDDRTFLGHTVEDMLERCDATVVVVVLPGGDAEHEAVTSHT